MSDEHPEHPDAGAELLAAAERYEQAEPGLGLAYAHESQNPGYWKRRYDDMLNG